MLVMEELRLYKENELLNNMTYNLYIDNQELVGYIGSADIQSKPESFAELDEDFIDIEFVDNVSFADRKEGVKIVEPQSVVEQMKEEAERLMCQYSE